MVGRDFDLARYKTPRECFPRKMIDSLEIPDVGAHVLHLPPLAGGLDDVVCPLLLVGRDEGALNQLSKVSISLTNLN